ncbi:unnamed protein product [Heligmosomoides polygyrus]|uniref:Col_cuticle_N domain-containing protein n=1 Tax=Heligmosomoides polygyrus TaxID=6339 RepID=A0A183FPA0_HELPZ|nr:unnamed protein product [Heligmosomoides polygyrus]
MFISGKQRVGISIVLLIVVVVAFAVVFVVVVVAAESEDFPAWKTFVLQIRRLCAGLSLKTSRPPLQRRDAKLSFV